jgi:hypothetical protein
MAGERRPADKYTTHTFVALHCGLSAGIEPELIIRVVFDTYSSALGRSPVTRQWFEDLIIIVVRLSIADWLLRFS